MLAQISEQDACLSCGACCAFFRVSFYGAEAVAIPAQMVEDLSPVYSCMVGTNQTQPHCIALEGKIGERVGCRIYPVRSSTCKQVQMGDSQCQKARAAYGLIALKTLDSQQMENDQDYQQVS